MSAATLSLVILAATVVLFVWNRLPVEVVALGCALTLLFTGLVDSGTVFSGFGDPVIVFIAALFVVSEGLESSGVTAWISRMLSRVGGTTYTRILITVMGLAAVVAAVITVNGAAAALLPVTVAVARSARIQTVPGPGAARVRVQRGRDADAGGQPGQRDHSGSVGAGGRGRIRLPRVRLDRFSPGARDGAGLRTAGAAAAPRPHAHGARPISPTTCRPWSSIGPPTTGCGA